MTANIQKIESTDLRTLHFHGDELITFSINGQPHVAMRRVVENLGIDWSNQHKKISEQAKFNCGYITTVGADGRSREMLCMPVDRLPLWLATINPNRIKDEDRRTKIELYQLESARALYDYWTQGVAVRSDMDGVVTDLDAAVMKRLGGMFKGIVHKELASVLPDMVQAELSSGHMSLVRGLTASQVLDMAGITNRKGMRGLATKVSNRLRKVHAEKGKAIKMASLGPIERYLFDTVVTKEWLAEGGKASIEYWAREKAGQARLQLVSSN